MSLSRSTAFVVAVLLSALQLPAAAGLQTPPKVYGVSPESCSQWLTSAPREPGVAALLEGPTKRLIVIAWVTGY